MEKPKRKRCDRAHEILMDTADQPQLVTPSQKNASHTWYRGEQTEHLPNIDALYSDDGIRDYIVKGWEPARRSITHTTNITAFGSCFAAHISKWLNEHNYIVLTDKSRSGDAYVVKCGEGMVNTYTILGQFEWAFEGRVPKGEFWHGYKAEAFGYDEDIREHTRDIFLKTDLFILTFGLSEIWYDKPTGEVFWRAIPRDKVDPKRHAFRVATVKENRTNLARIYALIRKHVPKAKVIFTLSPIPLIATFRPVSCFTANTVSKAYLRAAIEGVLQKNEGDGILHYWPGYEIIMDGFIDKWLPDRRHIKPEILDYLMTLFETVWCEKQPAAELLRDRLHMARIADGTRRE